MIDSPIDHLPSSRCSCQSTLIICVPEGFDPIDLIGFFVIDDPGPPLVVSALVQALRFRYVQNYKAEESKQEHEELSHRVQFRYFSVSCHDLSPGSQLLGWRRCVH